MAMLKFTTVLIPDEEGYQAIVPHYPEVTTWGKTPGEAFEMAKECLELILEEHAETHREQVLPGVQAPHIVVGAIEVEVPEALLKDIRDIKSEAPTEKAQVVANAD